MQTLEGMQAERRLREQIGRHSRRIQELASNPLYDPDAVKREKAKLRVEFMEELARDFTRSVGRLKALKTAAQRALSRRRVEDKLAEKPTDTLAARQLKATKRLEREMVMARTREELALLAAIEPARLVSTYHEALELAREAPGSVEWTARVEAIEETAPKLLERAILSADGADRSAARRALAYIDSAKKDALKSLRPESARQLEAVQNDFNELLLFARRELAALGEIKKANELAGRAAEAFNRPSSDVPLQPLEEPEGDAGDAGEGGDDEGR